MIIVDCVQGSIRWKRHRLGVATSSGFSKIVTPKRLTMGRGADTYLLELLAEWVTGHELEPWVSPWAERGLRLEPEARRFLAFELGREIEEVGFIYRDEERLTGCSPDGLIMDADGEPAEGAEIKCPAAKTHIGNMLDPDEFVQEYRLQVQGGLWVTGLPRWTICSYFPGLPPVLVRVEPEDEVQAALDQNMGEFLARLRALRTKLMEMGVEPKLGDPEDTPEWALPSVDGIPVEEVA